MSATTIHWTTFASSLHRSDYFPLTSVSSYRFLLIYIILKLVSKVKHALADLYQIKPTIFLQGQASSFYFPYKSHTLLP